MPSRWVGRESSIRISRVCSLKGTDDPEVNPILGRLLHNVHMVWYRILLRMVESETTVGHSDGFETDET